MREFDLLARYPQPSAPRIVAPNMRTIKNRIQASYRGKEFFDGDRNNGYGGYRYDGRWKPVAEDIIQTYKLTNESSVLQLKCEKGFLLHEIKALLPHARIIGTETSDYAMATSMDSIRDHVICADEKNLPFQDHSFDLVLGIGVVYAQNIEGAISILKEVTRVSKGHSFITLGSYRTPEEERLFRYWTLLGSTLLSEDEWVEVLKHSEYDGDYKFMNAKTLNLKSAK